jgi:hypothetical protein
MRRIRKLIGSVFIAGAAAGIGAAPTVVMFAGAPAAPQDQTVIAGPRGGGGPDGTGGGDGCGSGDGFQGCGGWNPFEGGFGFGQGCVNGICGGWDGVRGWLG